MPNDTFYAFNDSDSTALIRLIDKKGHRPGQRVPFVPEHCLVAIATTGVPARSGIILGEADVSLRYLDDTVSGLSIVDSGATIRAYNLATTAVATGAYIIIHQINSRWVVIWEACP